MVLNIISDAAVHSQAAAFSESSSQTELKCSQSAANVTALSWVCSSSSPALLWGLFVSCCWHCYPLTCRLKTVSAFTFVCSGDKILGKGNKTSIQSKLKVKKFHIKLGNAIYPYIFHRVIPAVSGGLLVNCSRETEVWGSNQLIVPRISTGLAFSRRQEMLAGELWDSFRAHCPSDT